MALNLDEVRDFVNDHIVTFHQKKVQSLESLNLNNLLRRKNPYLFRAKNLEEVEKEITWN